MPPHNTDATRRDLLKSLQRKNIELARANAALTVKLAAASDSLLTALHEKIAEQEKRLEAERKLMEAMSALDVIKVEVGKRVPVMEAVATHLTETASLFKHLLQLDYGEILVERIMTSCKTKPQTATVDRLPTIPEAIPEE